MFKSKQRCTFRAISLLVLLMFVVYNIMPSASFAATISNPDHVIIVVTDKNNRPIENADVDAVISIKNATSKDEDMLLKTNSEGKAVVNINREKYRDNNFTIRADVNKQGYNTNILTIEGNTINRNNLQFNVQLETSGFQVDIKTDDEIKYTGNPIEAVQIPSAIKNDKNYTIEYKEENKEWTRNSIKIKDLGSYRILVKITKRGVNEPFIKLVKRTIVKNTFELHPILKTGLIYNEKNQKLIDIPRDELSSVDKITYTVNGQASAGIPEGRDVGIYNILIHAERYGYKDFDGQYKAEISATKIPGLDPQAYNQVYDGQEHDAFTVTGVNKDTDTVEYNKDNQGWKNLNQAPCRIKDVAENNYKIKVRVSRKNYLTSNFDVIASIQKAEQKMQFVKGYNDGGETQISLDLNNRNNKYDFSAKADGTFDDDVNKKDIEYTVENASDDGRNVADIASIDAKGMLTVKKEGAVIIKAVRRGNHNYNDKTITYTLVIENDDKGMVYFDNDNVDYVFGEHAGLVSSQIANKKYDNDNGVLFYKINDNNVGLGINPETGEVRINDYDKLEKSLTDSRGILSVQVLVTKSVGTINILFGLFKKTIYGEASSSYTVTIRFMDTPENAYKVDGTLGKNGWYTSSVNVAAKDNTKYSVGVKCSEFADSVTFNNQGSGERYIFMQNRTTGGITARVPVKLSIDTEAPKTETLKITYSESIIDKFIEYVTFGYYNPSVKVKFTAEDETSGIDHFNWTYNRESGASESNVESKSGQVVAAIEDGKPTGTLVLTANEAEQFRGNISFTATDKAGLESEKVKGDKLIVVDTISPKCNMEYTSPVQTIGKVKYYKGDITAKFNITESNFYKDDIELSITKDGQTKPLEGLSWTKNNNDVYTASYKITGDGRYSLSAKYKDRSNNKMDDYKSDDMVIDTIAPIVDYNWNQAKQSIKFSITDRNFIKENVKVGYSVFDVNNNKLANDNLQDKLRKGEWTKDGDTYSIEISDLQDGYYDLNVSYTDPSGNKGEKKVDRFLIDHSKPTPVQITYSKSIVDTILSAVSFGYYNPDVEVTFTSFDKFSGVDSFEWNYMRADDASKINLDKDGGKLAAKQDQSDKSKYTASIVLPSDKAAQLKGSISSSATDKYGNTADTVTDSGKVIVVDTIAPEMTVSFNECSNNVNNAMYYNNDAIAKFKIKEANFDENDVKVSLSKDGSADKQIKLDWTKQEDDVYTASYKIEALNDHSNDGNYVFSVSYADKSGNKMKNYTSNTIVIDTIKPAINVSYCDKSPKYRAKDIEGNTRDYFGGTQTATVTVTEHNFDENKVKYDILAKDVSGKELSGNYYSKSRWTNDGDRHSMTITYPGNANYTFDMHASDLALNKANDYSKDYFTVDKTKPDNLEISYSNSILEKVINAVTFGFYSAKPTIKITAHDNISQINRFDYSYLKASGVSSVNKELRNQIISENNIKYSKGNSIATATFEVPKGSLNSNNQFNGTVEFKAEDRSGNEAESKGYKHIVVDNIAPKATVTLNSPVNTEGGTSYYDKAITCSVDIEEANFYQEDVRVNVTKDGAEASVTPSWVNNSADSHIGTFTLSGDGDYFITINYTDKSLNKMASYTSGKLTVDTKIESPTILINGENGDGKAYKDKVIPSVKFSDTNLSGYDVILTRTRRDDKNVDVTDKFIGKNISVNDKNGEGTFDTFDKVQDNDGIYSLTARAKDKAGHIAETTIKFTVNRFGSVYEYGDYLSSLVRNGGAYVKSLTSDLVVTEYNPDKLVDNSVVIDVTRDGRPLETVDYTASPEVNNNAAIGESGWYQYKYVIKKPNFAKDGVYKMSISSKDEAGNSPENLNYKEKGILFRVDSTAPEITSITGLDKEIVNSTKVNVKYNVFDAIGLKSVKVYVDGRQEGSTISKFKDVNNYAGTFSIHEENQRQKVRIVAEDMAGNITDTDSKSFKSAYAFNKNITVSTNALVRWYADKAVFLGTIVCVLSVIFIVFLIVFLKRKKDRKKEEKKLE
ncbi:MAG: hypothetical protein SPJ62_10555 [Inconstantimicrobium porci]|uniref:hypothetical protein n=1 Tax=Inconstantimicrobium porci TaxID=2652291 RepID=UPI002A91AFDC|nr:hypothetical protein [Inconstantimicrobium porci]MDY5912420.1 hypothetical protein [Inconstantimicrobium porci]